MRREPAVRVDELDPSAESRSLGRALVGALLVLLLLALIVGRAAGAAAAGSRQTARLTVEVTGMASDEGRVAFALFDSKRSFADGDRPLRRAFVEIRERRSAWRIEGLPRGHYAVKAYHDANGNGRLDFNLLGAPSESYGFSNDVRGRLGPPRYKRARFRLGAEETRISFTLR